MVSKIGVWSSEFKAGQFALFLAVTGLVGAIVGFFLGEIQMGDDDGSRFFPENLNAGSAVYFALVMLGIGTALVASQGLSERNFHKVGDTVLRALPAILIGGFISGFIAQVLYTNMLDDSKIFETISRCVSRGDTSCSELDSLIRPARAIGWMIAGGLGGIALGIGFRSKKRIQNGLIGGAAGGLIGGLLFDSIDNIFSTDSAEPSRFIALLAIGTLMGTLIGLVDTLRTEMWLTATSGEMAGRQFIIYDETTIVGCARNVPVTLLADRDVAEHHIQIERSGGTAKFTCLGNASPVLVNGVQQTTGSLVGGDLLRIGNTELRVGARSVTSSAPPTAQVSGTTESAEQSRPSLYSDKDDSGPTGGQVTQERPPSPTKPPPQPQQRPNILMKPKDDN